MKRHLKHKPYYWLLIPIIAVGCGAVFLGWRYFVKRDEQKPIAVVTTEAISYAPSMYSIMGAIELCSQEHHIAIKRYETDGSGEQTLRAFEKLYADGLRKVVGPMTSRSIDDAVQNFIALHSDLVVVTPSARSAHIGEGIRMPNFFRFVIADDRLMSVYGQLFAMRIPDLKLLIVISRDDAWGRSIVDMLQRKMSKISPQVIVREFFYKIPEEFPNPQDFIKNLSKVVAEVKEVLEKEKVLTAVLLGSFAEAVNYFRLVRGDTIFKIPHFGCEPLMADDALLQDKAVADFLMDVKFEVLEYCANNALSSKRYSFSNDLGIYLRKKKVESDVSVRSFLAYDATQCLALCQGPADIRKVLSDYYGTSGYIELDDHGNRTTGTFVGVGIVSDGTRYRLVPFSLAKQEVDFTTYGVIEQCGIDVNQAYEIAWDKKWDVTLQAIRYDLTSITAPFKPAGDTFTALISEYIVVQAKQGALSKEFIIFPTLAKNGVQVYMNTKTHDQWTKKATDKLYLADGADHPLVKNDEQVPAKGK